MNNYNKKNKKSKILIWFKLYNNLNVIRKQMQKKGACLHLLV